MARNSKNAGAKFMRQGHTAHIYGNDPEVQGKGNITQPPREIKAG